MQKLSNVDNVRLKVYGSSYIHFMESTVPPRMLDVDLLINDEVDLSNQDYLEQYIARLDALLRPCLENIHADHTQLWNTRGIERSTKNTWFVKCPRWVRPRSSSGTLICAIKEETHGSLVHSATRG